MDSKYFLVCSCSFFLGVWVQYMYLSSRKSIQFDSSGVLTKKSLLLVLSQIQQKFPRKLETLHQEFHKARMEYFNSDHSMYKQTIRNFLVRQRLLLKDSFAEVFLEFKIEITDFQRALEKYKENEEVVKVLEQLRPTRVLLVQVPVGFSEQKYSQILTEYAETIEKYSMSRPKLDQTEKAVIQWQEYDRIFAVYGYTRDQIAAAGQKYSSATIQNLIKRVKAASFN